MKLLGHVNPEMTMRYVDVVATDFAAGVSSGPIPAPASRATTESPKLLGACWSGRCRRIAAVRPTYHRDVPSFAAERRSKASSRSTRQSTRQNSRGNPQTQPRRVAGRDWPHKATTRPDGLLRVVDAPREHVDANAGITGASRARCPQTRTQYWPQHHSAVQRRHGIEPAPERSRKTTWKEFQREDRREAPAIGSESASGPSPNFDTNTAGMQHPARMPEGSGSSENLLEAMEMMRLWVLAFSALEWPSYPRTSHRPQGNESNLVEESIPAMMQSAEREM